MSQTVETLRNDYIRLMSLQMTFRPLKQLLTEKSDSWLVTTNGKNISEVFFLRHKKKKIQNAGKRKKPLVCHPCGCNNMAISNNIEHIETVWNKNDWSNEHWSCFQAGSSVHALWLLATMELFNTKVTTPVACEWE